MSHVRCFVIGLFFSVAMLSGLSCASAGPELHEVRGTLTFNGQPAEGATVILDPVGGGSGSKPSGIVAADGTFTISTHPHGDGALVGEYVVLVTWYPADARSQENPKNKLPPRYGDATKTPVPKVTVVAGVNELPPITLTGP